MENNITEDIEAPTTCSTSTLAEIESCEKHTVPAKDNSFAGHLQEIYSEKDEPNMWRERGEGVRTFIPSASVPVAMTILKYPFRKRISTLRYMKVKNFPAYSQNYRSKQLTSADIFCSFQRDEPRFPLSTPLSTTSPPPSTATS